jgi:hypothetical protein
MMIGALIVFCILASQATAIFSLTHPLKGTLNADATVFFLGKTSITGNSTGYPMEGIINSSLVQDMNTFPLIGATTISNLNTVIVVNNIDITTASSLEDLYLKYFDHITEYSDVKVTTDRGMFLLGINHGTMRVSSDLPYAVTTFIPFEITPGVSTKFFLTATMVPITLQCTGNFSVLTGLSNTSTIQIHDTHGAILWNGSSKNTYLVIQENTFSVTQQPPLLLFPLGTSTSTEPLAVSVTPADSQDISMRQLIKNIPTALQNFGEYNTTDIGVNFDVLDKFIRTTSLVTNGAMLLLQTNDTITIDHTTQRFSSVGFARFTILDATSTESSEGLRLQGDCSLIFLGDHFYNPQAKHSPTGTAFPYELIILWIVALCAFLSIRFFLRPDINEKRNNEMKQYTCVLQIILLVITLFLLDSEVNSQFGISAFSALFMQGFSMITGVFFFLELLLLVLGYVLLGLPIQILVNSGLRLFGIEKGGKGIGRGIGFLSIWVFCMLYLLLVLNTIISLVHLDIFFPMG